MTSKPLLALLAGLTLVGAAAAAPPKTAPKATPPAPPSAADFSPVSPDDLLIIETNKGRILAELTPFTAPDMVERVKTLARRHFYDGQSFFRVIEDFMDQTGDPKNTGEGASDLPNVKGQFVFRRDSGAPFVVASRSDDLVYGFIGVMPVMTQPDELMLMTADSKVNAWPLFCGGVLGAARASDPDSANSQFFLMRGAYPSLEKKYAAFGRVVVGEDVVRSIKAGEPVPDPQDKMITVRLASDLPEAQRPKVFVLNTRSDAFKRALEAQKARDGADFNVCDVDIPAEIR